MVTHGGLTVSVIIIQRDRQKDSCGLGVGGFCRHKRFLRGVVMNPFPIPNRQDQGLSMVRV